MRRCLLCITLCCFYASFLEARDVLTQEEVEKELRSVKGPYNESVVKEYIHVFHDISKERKVMDEEDIDDVSNPFLVPYRPVVYDVKTEVKPIVYSLNAIVEDRANINNKWYKRHDKIEGAGSAKLLKIKENSVIIQIANKTKEIKLNKGSENVQISFQ